MTHTRVTPAPGSLKRHQTRTAYTFLALPLVFFLIVRFLPTFLALRMSLFDWNILKEQQPFVGLDNYRELFQDAKFGQALKNTALYTLIGVPAQIALLEHRSLPEGDDLEHVRRHHHLAHRT